MTAPTMTFGVKTTDDVQGDTGDYIHRFSKEGEYRLRFLEEFDDWTVYWEHFSADKKTSYPCTGNKRECPGCTSPSEKEAKASKKFLVNALQSSGTSEQQGYVHLWKLPYASLKEDLDRYRKKSGDTLTDRDYTVIRHDGAGGVSYSIDREEREPIDLGKYALQDHQAALLQEYQEAWDPEIRAAKQKEIADRRAAKDKKDSDERQEAKAVSEEQADEPVPDALLSKAERDAKAKGGIKMAADPEPEEEVTLTPSAIRKMDASKLVKLYKDGGFEDELDGLNGSDRDALAEKLIELLTQS